MLILHISELSARQTTPMLKWQSDTFAAIHIKESHLFSKKGFGRPVERASEVSCFNTNRWQQIKMHGYVMKH
jgi:hypothetical protein